jgi:hypothetical protein
MTYSSTGLIQATDYNTRATSVNTIWGTGSGSNGYGQSTTVSSVSATNTVAASNWATLISRIDSMRNHQSGTTSGITQPSAGGTITFLSTLDTQISTITTNALSTNTRGTALPTGLGNPAIANSTAWTTGAIKEFSVTWSSADTVRYFFNAGGLVTFYLTMSGGSTSKTTDWANFYSNQVGTISIGSNFCSRTGTGSPVANTGTGYWGLSTGYSTLFEIGSTSATADYGQNYILIQAKQITNGISIYTSSVDSATDTFNDTVNGTLNVYVGYTPPETTYLANTWGSLTYATVTNTQS